MLTYKVTDQLTHDVGLLLLLSGHTLQQSHSHTVYYELKS